MNAAPLPRILLACLLPFLLVVVAPFTFYFGNVNEIAFSLEELAWPMIGLFAAFSALLYLILWIFRSNRLLSAVLAGLLAGLALAVWIQSQLFAWKFGLLNGQKINWAEWRTTMYLEGAVWIVVLAMTLLFFLLKTRKHATLLLSGICLAGILSVAAAWISAPRKTPAAFSEPEFEDVFLFHPEKNVLVILLDTYQSDYFDLVARKYPDDIRELDGFTFYRNTSSHFPTTKGSLPSILTGALYLNDQPFSDFFNEANRSFYMVDAYKQRAFRSHMVGLPGSSPGVVPMSRVVERLGTDYVHPVYEYLDYALFRALPAFFKPCIYNSGRWLFSCYHRKNYPPGHIGTDIRFTTLFRKAARVTREKGVEGSFKFFHFSLPHAPSMIDEKMQYNTRLSGTDGYLRQARGTIRMTGTLLSTLKRLGIYDKTEIVLMSDHGTMNIPQAGGQEDPADILSPVPNAVRTSSHALLLHKPAGSSGNLVITDVPMVLSDLAWLLGLRDRYTADLSKRTFYFYDWDDDWNNEYMPDMTEYVITGHVFGKSSYAPGKNIYTSGGIVRQPEQEPYPIGTPVLFEAGGKSTLYMRGGWSLQEPGFRWTVGSRAGLSFQLEKDPVKDMVLHLLGCGYNEPGSKEIQKARVIVNGTRVAQWILSEEKEYLAPVPASLVPDGKIDIIFEFSSPRKYPVDTRPIAMQVRKLVISEK